MKNFIHTYYQNLFDSRFLRYGLSFLILLAASSCKELIEENPKMIAEETFYNTSQEVETAVNAIYTPLRQNPQNGAIGVNSVYGEFTYGRGSWAALNDYSGLNDTWITRVSGWWQSLYLGIRNANLVIKNIPKAKSLSQANIDKFMAEAKFLRAFTYFQLVKNWGGVPLRTENNIMDINVKRSTESEVYALITSDLLEAEANLPDVPRLIGTPSKWAAKTLLADVYLFLKMYDKASQKAGEVIASNKYSLVQVASTDDFQKIFGPKVVTTTEEIFYFRYSHDKTQGNTWPALMNHPGTGLYGKSGVYGVYGLSTNPAYKNWDNNDLRKGQWYPWNIGVGANSLLSKKLIDPETAALDGGANSITWYRYADVLLIYAEAACRTNNGPTADAVEALNKVHRRAYGYSPVSSSPVDFKIADYNLNTFINLVLQERGYEFDLEGKRWSDLKRTGKAEEIILAVKGKTVAQKNYLWPIPVNEFNFNTALDPVKDQNPGY